jgi:hypothetical protein
MSLDTNNLNFYLVVSRGLNKTVTKISGIADPLCYWRWSSCHHCVYLQQKILYKLTQVFQAKSLGAFVEDAPRPIVAKRTDLHWWH